jgi:tetratricopeptide (TPR) repeat protein
MESAARFVERLHEMERRLQDNRAEAERWLPRLLTLSVPDLSHELAQHPELQPGISRLLLEVVDDTVRRDANRAYELTAVVTEYVEANRSLSCPEITPDLRAKAWTAHAGALRALGRHLEALVAIAAARGGDESRFGNAWSIALAEVEEARILHDMGETTEALLLIRRGAEVILLHGDVERYVKVRMYETLMLWETGQRTEAAEVWRTMAREASHRGDAVFMALLESATAVFQLRHGGAAAAARLFETAHQVFDKEGLTREAVRARWGVAEAAVARGRYHDAISEYYKVQALSLAAGNVREAALASAEIVDLLLLAGRVDEVPSLAELMMSVFAAPEQQKARMAWLILHECTLAGVLTPSRIDVVRRFFRDQAL